MFEAEIIAGAKGTPTGAMLSSTKTVKYADELPPLPKGRGTAQAVEGYAERYMMIRKHNKQLTSYAKQLRKNMTKEERHLWYDYLKNYPVRFLRQKVVDNYIADFYCSKVKLIIELDGAQHYEPDAILKDKIRTRKINERNITVIRIPNNEVNNNFSAVCEYIDNFVKKIHIPPPLMRSPSL